MLKLIGHGKYWQGIETNHYRLTIQWYSSKPYYKYIQILYKWRIHFGLGEIILIKKKG